MSVGQAQASVSACIFHLKWYTDKSNLRVFSLSLCSSDIFVVSDAIQSKSLCNLIMVSYSVLFSFFLYICKLNEILFASYVVLCTFSRDQSTWFLVLYWPDLPVFLIDYLYSEILPAALGPGVYSPSNRNEYRKHKKKCFWGIKCGWCVGLTTLLPSMSRLSRVVDNVGFLTSHNPIGLHGLLRG
jgi:hypothetical protein